jgi:hypothetical protein
MNVVMARIPQGWGDVLRHLLDILRPGADDLLEDLPAEIDL